MRVRQAAAFAAAVIGLVAMATDASAQRRDRFDRDGDRDRDRDRDREWVELGCQRVGFGVDRDVIRVGRREGRFRAIRLRASENWIEMLDLKVVYSNGDPDDLSVRSVVRPGEPTRPIDLRGRERSIDRIEMVYRSNPSFRGRARICIEGLASDVAERPDRGDGDRRDWVELGCQRVGFFVDRDVIRVGRREGRFKAIRLRANENWIEMLGLKVLYTNGEPDDLPVRSVVRPGEPTRPIDLRGRERSIDRIEMVYRSNPSFRGRSRICVEGLQD
jgi:hypothetical protein